MTGRYRKWSGSIKKRTNPKIPTKKDKSNHGVGCFSGVVATVVIQGIYTVLALAVDFSLPFILAGTVVILGSLLLIRYGIQQGGSWGSLLSFVASMALLMFLYSFAYLTTGSIEGDDFVNALYLSAVTFSTLGYGDITPISTAGKFLAASQGLIGNFLMAMLAVKFTLLSQKKD